MYIFQRKHVVLPNVWLLRITGILYIHRNAILQIKFTPSYQLHYLPVLFYTYSVEMKRQQLVECLLLEVCVCICYYVNSCVVHVVTYVPSGPCRSSQLRPSSQVNMV